MSNAPVPETTPAAPIGRRLLSMTNALVAIGTGGALLCLFDATDAGKTRTAGATASGRLRWALEKRERGESLEDGERMLVAEHDAAPDTRPEASAEPRSR